MQRPNFGVILNSPFVSEHHLLTTAPKANSVEVSGGNGGPVRSVRSRNLPLTLGKIFFGSVPTDLSLQKSGVLADAAYSGLIGTRALERYNLTLDYAGQALYVEPRATYTLAVYKFANTPYRR